MDLIGASAIFLISLGPLSLFFPVFIKKITDKFPILYYFALIISLLSLLPLFYFGNWSLVGLEYKNTVIEFIYEGLSVFVFLFYVCGLTYIGLLFQKLWKMKEESYGIALLGGIILASILYFNIARWFLME